MANGFDRKPLCAPDDDRQVVENIPQPDCPQQHQHQIIVCQGAKDPLEDEAQDHVQQDANDERNRIRHLHTHHHPSVPNDPKVGADHIDLAVGKVDQAHRAIDHRVAQRDQRVQTADADAAD